MRAEGVPGEWVEAAGKALWAAGNKPSQMAHAIAAVYPLIARAERERAAVWHDEQAAGEDALAEHAIGADRDAWLYHRHTAATHRESAAAIRALPDEVGG